MIDAGDFKARLTALESTIKGLSIEIEGGRINANSNASFILDVLRDVLDNVKELRAAVPVIIGEGQ